MKKIIISFIVLCLLGCSSLVNRYVYKSVDPVSADNFYSSVGIVRVEHNSIGYLSGTAFAYDKDHLLTAAHVCIAALYLQIFEIRQESIKLYITDDNGNLFKMDGVEVDNIFTTDDICMLKKKNHGLKPVKLLKNYNNLKTKDRVFLIGAPVGMGITDFHGKVITPKAQLGDKNIKNRLIISAAATGGVSGSPVFNMKGEVVGILVMGHTTFDHLSICVTADKIHEFLVKHGY